MNQTSTLFESNKQNETFDLKSYIKNLISFWWLFPISILLCVGIVILYLSYSTPKYRITAKIIVEDEKKGGTGLNASAILGDMNGLLNVKSNVDNEVEVLKTRMMAEKVVKALHLNVSYYLKGKIKDYELFQAPFIVELLATADSLEPTSIILKSHNKNQATITYTNSNKKEISKVINYGEPFIIEEIGALAIKLNPPYFFLDKNYKFFITSEDVATLDLQKELAISVPNKSVTTIDISIDHSVPKKGEAILGKFIEGYMQQSIIDKNRTADSTIKFIENRLLLVSQELGGIEGEIQRFKQSNEIADISEQSKMLIENTSTYGKELSELETKVSIIGALQEILADENKYQRVVPNALMEEDLVFSKLAESYNLLLLERDKQLLTSTEENPYIQNLDQRIKSVRNAMYNNLSSTKQTLEISLAQLQKKLDKLVGQIQKVPAHERAYLGMFRQQTLKQELYLFLLQKREETALSKTSNFSNAKMIDYPKSELKPFKPNKKTIFLAGLGLGFVLPFVFVYIKELLNNKVQSKEDVLKATNIPILGEIGHIKPEEEFIYNNPRSVISEQFRGLRTNLSFYFGNEKGKTILITSSTKGEGKTLTSINLATILAISGKSVLLVDLDLRRASLTEKLKHKGKLGFTNYIITETTPLSNIILPSGFHNNLFVVPAGVFPPNPAETLMHERTETFISEVKKLYDFVILDAPPVGLVTDAQLLQKFAAITLYLVRQNYTLKSKLSLPQELYVENKIGKMGIILNDIKAYENMRYGYSYGYGDEENKSKNS